MDLQSFFETVVTADKGNFNLCHSNQDGSGWKEEWFEYPTQINRVIERIGQLKEYNVYFSPYLFKDKQSVKANAIVGRTFVADLDDANVLTMQYAPTVLVETSPNRHQGYWILDEPMQRADHEHTSKKLTYSILACDPTGWFLGKRVRVPTSTNYKYDREDSVRIIPTDSDGRTYQVIEFSILPEVPTKTPAEDTVSDEWIAKAIKSIGPQELMSQVRAKLPTKVYTQYNNRVIDRSAALWALMTNAFRINLSVEQVFVLARGSANNKFSGLRFNGDRELLKDVLRARQEVSSGYLDNIKDKIYNIRKLQGSKLEKNMFIADQIKEDMKGRGHFISCMNGTAWFIENQFGKPIPIVQRGEALLNFLELTFGINASENESRYIVANLISYVSTLPQTGILSSLSYYDVDANVVLVHTGRKHVLRVSPSRIESVINGYEGIVFPWIGSTETLDPSYKTVDKTWDEVLFDNALNNIVGLEPKQAQSLLKVWMLMLLLRNIVVSRPILALFGQPGAGKSTLFRRIYTILYGRYKSLSSITSPDNFDIITSTDPLVIFDNSDTWERWLPDRLALAAAASEVTKRKLYTNSDTITMKRDAFVGMTAHSPKFGREDVIDRLIIITLERLSSFQSETEILNYIFANRSILWGGIISDIQRVLSTPVPTVGYPQYRIEDFSKYGFWIATALGIQENFTSAIKSISTSQKEFNLEEDALLIDAIGRYLLKGDAAEFKTPGRWYSILESRSTDQQSFQRSYRNAVVLGKKLWTLQDSLKTIFNVDVKYDKDQGSRIWKFERKNIVA